MPENCAAIVIAAKHHELFKVKDTRGTTKTVGALRCKFDFRTNDWNNSAKTAMFCNGNVVLHPKLINDAIAMPLDVDNECAVPAEVLDDTLPYSIGVWGVTNSGLRIVSNWLIFNAQIGCYTDGNAPADPEPTLYEQILSIADNAARAAQDLINRANNGEFDGETPYIGENGNWWVAELDTGVRAHGKSAYEVACANGFEGTSTEWLASLVGATGADGKSAYEVALDGGFKGTQQEWLASLVGAAGVNGKSAYEIAKEHGFNGTEQEWLNSLVGKDGTPGKDGINGKSAYELAKDNGFSGTEAEWLQSLIGKDGSIGPAGVNGKSAYDLAVDNGFDGTEQEWLESLVGKDGIIGVDGKSAYDIAKEHGFEGTEAEWIESLTGADGVGVAELSYNDENELIVTMTDGTEKNVGKVRVDIEALREIFAAKEDVKQSDWNQSDNSQVDYIKNKPQLGALAAKDKVGNDELDQDVQERLDAIPSIEGLATEEYVDKSIDDLAPVAKSGSFNNLKHQPSVMFTVTDDGVLCMNMTYTYEDANVTYMDETGSTILYSQTLYNCGFAKNPVDDGDISEPTKESTAQYHYTFDGWSLTPGGSSNKNALMNINTDRTVYAAFTGDLRSYTVTFKNDDDTILHTETVNYGENATYSTIPTSYKGEDWIFAGWNNPPENITGDIVCIAEYIQLDMEMDDMSWREISARSNAGTAANYFAVGDAKAVTLDGTVGTLALDNVTYYVYILGFDHNSTYEGNGITFGCFKTAQTGGIDVALCDSKYGSSSTDGTKYFNMNHWGNNNYGGWAGSDMRYDILGSTNVAPSVYGKSKTTSNVGYDPTETCAITPVENTLMAALPSDLRAVIKPMTKYTNNVGNSGGTAEKVTVSVDYLPLLAEYEIFGARTYANSAEQNYQQQYAYFASGNSKKKYQHSSTGSSVNWWERSAGYNNSSYFCDVLTNSNASRNNAGMVFGLAPAFKV